MTDAPTLWALVLAGGDGTRLRNLTRLIAGAPIPKQYCRIIGRHSLLEATIARIAPLAPAARTLVVVNARHAALAGAQLAALPAGNVLVQPRNLDTGPGILVSLLELARRDPAATLAIFPSDHDVRNPAAFRRRLGDMTRLVARHPGRIVLLGVRPERPEPGYGYIARGAPLDETPDAFEVAGFHEKPTPAGAARLIRTGAVWNTFVMVARVDALLDRLCAARPDDVAALAPVPLDPGALAPVYDRLRGWSFSRDFLARVPEQLLLVSASELGWSDWGTPEAIERTVTAMGVTPPWLARRQATA